jgi:hypothetical protein
VLEGTAVGDHTIAVPIGVSPLACRLCPRGPGFAVLLVRSGLVSELFPQQHHLRLPQSNSIGAWLRQRRIADAMPTGRALTAKYDQTRLSTAGVEKLGLCSTKPSG